MNDQQPTPPRRRLQELLAIPDSQRTDEQWDELNELEIQMAPVNRGNASPEREGGRRNNGPRPSSAHPKPSVVGAAPAKKPFKKFHKKPPKPAPV